MQKVRSGGPGQLQGAEESKGTTRRKLTTLDKLKVMIRQSRCPVCGEKLGELEDVEFDHEIALVNGGEDVLENLRAVHRSPCHDQKTNGPGGERRITTAGSDKHIRDKTRNLQQQQKEYRDRLLAKDSGEPPPKPKKPKYQWPKRKMESRNTFRDRRS